MVSGNFVFVSHWCQVFGRKYSWVYGIQATNKYWVIICFSRGELRTHIVLHTFRKLCFVLENRIIIKISTHPCNPRNFHWFWSIKKIWKKNPKFRFSLDFFKKISKHIYEVRTVLIEVGNVLVIFEKSYLKLLTLF